ncbi:hypothetical protein C7E17_23905, partial [Stenotrophomonas maltophilia]
MPETAMKIRPITTTLLAASLLLALAACKGPEAEQAKQDAQHAVLEKPLVRQRLFLCVDAGDQAPASRPGLHNG